MQLALKHLPWSGRAARAVRVACAALTLPACLVNAELSGVDLGLSTITAATANVPALPGQSTAVRVQLRSSRNVPVAGITVSLAGETCTVTQPSAPTDAQGAAVAQVACLGAGQKLLYARLSTDGFSLNYPAPGLFALYTPLTDVGTLAVGQTVNAQAFRLAADGSVDPTYAGTVHFSSSDPLATLPPDTALMPGDHGVRVWTSAVAFHTAGTQTVTAVDAASGAVLARQAWTVVAQHRVTLQLALGAAQTVAGVPLDATISALDPNGLPAADYQGTVDFASSDPNAQLSEPLVFSPADAGVKHVAAAVTLVGAGAQHVSVADAQGLANAATVPVTVQAGAASSLVLQVPPSVKAGQPADVAVAAYDAFGNLALGSTGTLHFSSSDAQGLVPADVVLGPTAPSVVLHNGLTLRTAGTQALAVSLDPGGGAALVSASANVAVAAVPAARLVVSLSGATAGKPVAVALRATDANGLTASGYTGTVHFASTDPQAALPANVRFVAQDFGSKTVTPGATFFAAGSQTLSATDVLAAEITGSAATTVVAGAPTQVVASLSTAQPTAGVAFDVVVSGADAYGNTAPDFADTVAFVTSDGSGTVPGPYAFQPQDAGRHVFAGGATLLTAGAQSVGVADSAQPGWHAVQLAATVQPGPATRIDPGDLFNFQYFNQYSASTHSAATVYDAYNNVATNYRGTLTATCNDPNATQPVAYTYTAQDAGMHYFGVIYNTLGWQTWTLTDPGTPTLASNSWDAFVGHNYDGSAYGDGVSNGTGVSYRPSFGLDANAVATVAFYDTNSGSQVFVKRFVNGNWQGLAGSGSAAGLSSNSAANSDPALALDANGNPGVAWVATQNGNDAIYYAQFDGTAWAGRSGSSSGGGIVGAAAGEGRPSVAFLPSGQPCVAWHGPSASTDQDIFVACYSGSAWVGPGGSTNVTQVAGNDTQPVLAIGAGGRPVVAYQSDAPGHSVVRYLAFNGTAWVGLGGSDAGGGVSQTTGNAADVSMALDGSGNPLLAWDDDTAGNAEIYVRRWNGTAWVELAASGSGGGISKNTSASTLPHIALDGSGQPVVVWRNVSIDDHGNSDGRVGVFLRHFDGSAWNESFLSATGAGTGLAFRDRSYGSVYPQVLVLPSGDPLIVYQTDTYGRGGSIVADVWR